MRRPKWLFSHLLALALVGACVGSGLWQVNRHQDRADFNASVEARIELPVTALDNVVSLASGVEIGEAQEFRRVSVEGEFRSEDQVTIRNRSFGGAPGVWLVTPLMTNDGWAVAVNRGWIPTTMDPGDAPPPTGPLEVQGWIQPSRRPEGFQSPEPADGKLDSLARPDLERLAEQLDYAIMPVVVQQANTGFVDPLETTTGLPQILSRPVLDRGPHFSYAVQWFIFATIAAVGYPLILRRAARGKTRSLPNDLPEYDY